MLITRADMIQEKFKNIVSPSGTRVQVLEDEHAIKISGECACTMHDVYMESLRLGITPYRYLKNRKSIRIEDQLKLAESKVAVAGAGGLGGQALILLARLGIGSLTIVDYDEFDETNLNRQAFCNSDTLGSLKVEVAAAALGSINPGVETEIHPVRINESNAHKIIEGADVIVDGLDTIADRFVLEAAAKKLNIPFVHAAIAGFEGQVMTVFPEDKGLETIYGREPGKKKGRATPESVMGIPSLTPAVIASFQVMEVLKIILGTGSGKQNRMFYVQIETDQTDEFHLGSTHDRS